MFERLKVLFLSGWYPSHENPVNGIFVREHAKAVQLFDDVTVFHLPGRDQSIATAWRVDEEKDKLINEGIKTYRIRYRNLILPKTAYLSYLLSVLAAFRTLWRQGYRPNVIHAHIYNTGVPAIILGKLYHLPVVITEQSSAFPRRLLKPFDVHQARFAFQNADKVLPVSLALQKGIEAYKIRGSFHIIPNVVDTSLFTPVKIDSQNNKGPFRILYTGSMLEVKGTDILLRALALLKHSTLAWHADLVGGGKELERFVSMAHELGLDDVVTFHGQQPKAQVARYMQNADLFVLPSRWDSQPCVLVESMACGLPIVASNVGGIPETVDPGSGILTTAEDPQALCDALLRIIEGRVEFKQEDILKNAQRYSPESVGSQIDSIYREVMKSDYHRGQLSAA